MRRVLACAAAALACLHAIALAAAPQADTRVTVYPAESREAFGNPLMGWAYIDHAIPREINAGRTVPLVRDGTVYRWFDCVQVLSTWALVEPQPDRLDWTLMDRSIAYWSGAGKAVHLRFSTDDFGIIPGCPRWLFDRGVPRFDRKGDGTSFPDYNHPVYRRRLARFLRAFADRYAGDPRIETIDLRAYGNWGEWHSGANYPRVADRVRALRGLIDLWRGAVRGRRPLNLSASYEWQSREASGSDVLPAGTSIYDARRPTFADYLTRSAFDYALRCPDVTFRRDGVGGAVFQEYDGRLLAAAFEQRRLPLFMEFFGGLRDFRGPSVVGFPGTRAGDDFVGNAIDEAISHHPNYISPPGWGDVEATRFYNEDRDLMLEGLRWMGYRFALVRASWPASVAAGAMLPFAATWENRAAGRCWKPFPLAVTLEKDGRTAASLVDRAFDQTNLVSGETTDTVSALRVPASLAPGDYDLGVAMVDARGAPAIRLAIVGGDGSRRWLLGRVHIAAPPAMPPAVRMVRPTLAIPAGGAALVSFRYRVTRAPARDLTSDAPGRFAVFAEDASGARYGDFRWYDAEPGRPAARKTVLLTAPADRACTVRWETEGGGRMRVDDVRVEPVAPDAVRRIDTRSASVRVAPGARVDPRAAVEAERERSAVRLPDDRYPFLSTDPRAVRLEPDATYTVWFDCAARPQVWQGDYLALTVWEGASGAPRELARFRWTQRHTSGDVRRAYSFRTGPGGGAWLEWSIRNGGRCAISNIVLHRR